MQYKFNRKMHLFSYIDFHVVPNTKKDPKTCFNFLVYFNYSMNTCRRKYNVSLKVSSSVNKLPLHN